MLRRFRCVQIFLELYTEYVLCTVALAPAPASKRLPWFYRHGCSECRTRILGRWNRDAVSGVLQQATHVWLLFMKAVKYYNNSFGT